MATYQDQIKDIRDRHGFWAKPCWIADVRSANGLTNRVAGNRIHLSRRKSPCPAHRRAAAEDSLRHFGMIL